MNNALLKKLVIPVVAAAGINSGLGTAQRRLEDDFIDNIVDRKSSEPINDARTVDLNILSKQNLPMYKIKDWPNAAFFVNRNTGEKGLLFGKYKGKSMNSREVVAHELGHASNYDDPNANWRIKTSGIRGLLSSSSPFVAYLTARLNKLNRKKSLLTALGVGSAIRGLDKLVTLREEGEASRKAVDLLKKYNAVNSVDKVNIDESKNSLDRAYRTYAFDALATPAKVGASVLTTHALFELGRKIKKVIKR